MPQRPEDDRLSQSEYIEALRRLYTSGPPKDVLDSVGGDLPAAYRKQEAMLTIEHRLGRGFPQERREAVWRAMEGLRKNRLRLVIKWLFRKRTKREFASGMQGILSLAADDLAKILSPQELKDFIDVEPGRPPVLALDPGKLEDPDRP